MRIVKPGVIFAEASMRVEILDYLEYELRQEYASGSDGIVLFIRSPGGHITKVPETATLIERISQEKPVFAYTDDMMGSAAYWLGASADRIYAAPSARVGSVGAFAEMLDFSEKFINEGVEHIVLRSGDDKARIGVDGQMREQDKAELQAQLCKLHSQFKSHILRHRDIAAEHLEGKAYEGEEALKFGFIDGFADSIYDFLDMLNIGGVK